VTQRQQITGQSHALFESLDETDSVKAKVGNLQPAIENLIWPALEFN